MAEADVFLRRHLPVASYFKSDQFKRIDQPALPVLAVREALINAIVHRDYADQYTDISLAIYDDRLEIWNSGTLLKNLTVENLKSRHQSVLRNKLIANAFYVRGWIEKWGIGTNKMIDLCKHDSLPEPDFEEYSDGISVTFKFRESIGINKQDVAVNHVLNRRQEEILSIIKKHGPIAVQQLIKELESYSPTRTVQKDLNSLKKMGLAGTEGSAKKTKWVFKSK